MVHRNARLTVTGRLILVRRVLAGRPVSHVAKEMGVCRQCAHRWLTRYRAHGEAGLSDRSSRPVSSPSATPAQTAAAAVELRSRERLGRDDIARACGVSPRTASRLIARAGLPALHELDPVTGIALRASRRTQVRYERDAPGDLIHVDMKKLGRVPEGGGWRVEGPDAIDHNRGRVKSTKLGFDYVHVAVDDHSRLAFAQILPDEKGTTCAAFLTAAAEFFARHGVQIREVMTDNAKNYTVSTAFQGELTRIEAKHITTRPHCPWQNGKAERFNRTMQEYWAYPAPYVSNQHRADALAPWLEHYNYARPHTACDGQPPPINRMPPTS